MSIDRSLKVKGALSRHRNVLSRDERIQTLKLEERFTDGDAVIGLPKVAHRKASTGKKEAKVKTATPEAAAAAGTPAAPAAAPSQQKKAAAKK
jgi:small basic protein (TIGR04137 family)